MVSAWRSRLPDGPDLDPRPKVSCPRRVHARPVLSRLLTGATIHRRFLFGVNGDRLRLYSVATGSVVRTLKGHTGRITSVVINPNNPLQVVTSGEDCTIRFWNYTNAVLLRTLTTEGPVSQLMFSRGDTARLFWAYQKTSKNGKVYSRVYEMTWLEKNPGTAQGALERVSALPACSVRGDPTPPRPRVSLADLLAPPRPSCARL